MRFHLTCSSVLLLWHVIDASSMLLLLIIHQLLVVHLLVLLLLILICTNGLTHVGHLLSLHNRTSRSILVDRLAHGVIASRLLLLDNDHVGPFSVRATLVSQLSLPVGHHSSSACTGSARGDAAEQEEEGHGPPEPLEPEITGRLASLVVAAAGGAVVVETTVGAVAEVVRVGGIVDN